MRTIALEEHCRPAGLPGTPDPRGGRLKMIDDLGPARLADMDAAGIDVEVLSLAGGTTQAINSPTEGPAMARRANDLLAEAVAAHATRFAAFAALPTAVPAAAAAELERAVRDLGFKGALLNGRLGGRFLDDPSLWPILEAAESLGVPLYLHPAEPSEAVRREYYTGFGAEVDTVFSRAGWGWHIETGIHALRLILGGVFDRFPRLQIIIGHMGEAVPFMLARSDETLNRVAKLRRPLQEYFLEHFYITTSGFFTHPPLLCALLVMGADRILFSVDYPYSGNEQGRTFLDTAPISPADLEKIAHGNAERLLRL